MNILVLIFLVGATITTADLDGAVLIGENTLEELEIRTFDSVDIQCEMSERELFRKGCSTGKACRRKKGTCISSSEECNGRVYSKGCGANCTCCIMEPERCQAQRKCKEANGICMKNSEICTGLIIPEGCTGRDCVCCINDNKCPSGFYHVGSECFKIYQQMAGWDEARRICQRNGWELAEPEDSPTLSKFIYANISHYYFWLGGRGIGDSFKLLSGQTLQDDAQWALGYPGDNADLGDCLILRSTNTSYTAPLASYDCYGRYYFICEPACPEGFIRSGSGCFKVETTSRNWEDSEKNCYEMGLQIAEPEDPKHLAKLLYFGTAGGSRYTGHHFWIGARGGRINGSLFAWNSGDQVPYPPYPIAKTWHPSYPRSTTSAYCLQFYTGHHTAGPVYELGCTGGRYSICELICPLGFFHIGNNCYKAYSSSASSWAEAGEVCNQAHLTLAEPQDPTAVADYLHTVTGDRNYWLGGKGDGNRFYWSSGDVIATSWSPWRPGNPGNKVGSDYCLRLSPEYRTTPLSSLACSTPLYPLCQ